MGSSNRHGGARTGSGQRRGLERRALQVGLAISLIVHVLAIVWVDRWLRPEPAGPVSSTPVMVVPPSGMRAVDLAVVKPEQESTPRPEPPRPRPAEPAPRPKPPPVPARVPAEAEARKPDARSAVDRLAPRVVDPRFYEPMVLVPRSPNLSDVQARIGAAVELLSDSALAAADRALRSRDWTVEDKKGGKWGITPGKLHLGSLTLPLPLFLVSDDEFDPKASRWIELQNQTDRAAVLESFKARVKAIRERRDRERAERKTANGGGSDPPSPPR